VTSEVVTLRLLTAETFADFAAMHGRPECFGCFCMYWHFEGDNRAWQQALPAENLVAKRRLVDHGETHGMLAYSGADVVASAQFHRRDELTKLTARMPYHGLETDPSVWAVSCFVVLPEQRHRAIAARLLGGIAEHVREVLGGSSLEAYPRRGADLRDEEVWTGPERLFAANGFIEVREHLQYPIFRRVLR